jgi:hypothetical protein
MQARSPSRCNQRPDRWQHPTTAKPSKNTLALKGASTDETTFLFISREDAKDVREEREGKLGPGLRRGTGPWRNGA